MKNILFITICVMLAGALTAQVTTPRPSPTVKIEQEVGLSTVTLDYSRPGVKDRQIFGDLVPYNEYWRTGANQSTKVTFSQDVNVLGGTLEAGTYTLFTKPTTSDWEVIFYTDLSANTPGGMKEENVALRGTVPSHKLSSNVESFNLFINNLRDASASLDMMWADKHISIPFSLDTEKEVMASIESTMAGPSANDFRSAANYYSQNGKDLKQALTWINKSLEMAPGRFWVLRDKSNIQAKLGDVKGAIATAKESMAAAKEAGNMQYVKFNEEAIAKWMKM